MDFAARAIGGRDDYGIDAELVRARKALDLVDLHGQDRAQSRPHSRQAQESLIAALQFKLRHDPFLLRFHLLGNEIVQREGFAQEGPIRFG